MVNSTSTVTRRTGSRFFEVAVLTFAITIANGYTTRPSRAAEPSPNANKNATPTSHDNEQLNKAVALRIDNVNPANAQNPMMRLRSNDSRAQLLLTAVTQEQREFDVTRQVTYSVEPSNVVSIDSTGLMKPQADGIAKVTASLPNGVSTTLNVECTGNTTQPQVNFPNQIVPIFTKFGCNGGGCHGKAAGQNGFKLSLLGFEPKEDFEHLLFEARGRRLFPAAPERSLLVTKAINDAPHGGGQRLDKDSHEYRLLVRWIAQGMPYGSESDPVLGSIEIFPKQRMLNKQTSQQLVVMATYSDGSVEDITRTAQYESNNTDMANVTTNGLVTASSSAGDVAVMARYQGRVAVFRASLPQGAPVSQWPESKNFVDDAIIAKLKTLGIPMSDICSDNEYIRRTTLDIAGRLPTIAETQEFLSNQHENKRAALVDRLLDSPDYASYFALKWNAILRNRRATAGHQMGSFAFHDWIRESFETNKPYDQFVRELVTASGSPEINPPVAWFREVSSVESRSEDIAQLFLGQRLQCARCHHHPFEKWSQDDYYHFAAFFSLINRKEGATPEQPVFVSKGGQARMNNPKNGKALPPAGLDAQPVVDNDLVDPRIELAQWMTSPENPFFARIFVNRMWKHFFSRALVEPEDDMRVTNPASNEELITALADHFVKERFDIKQLIRNICNSRAYQSKSDVNEHNITDTTTYSRYYPKRLPAEVMLDAIDRVVGTKTAFPGVPVSTRAIELPDSGFESYFLTVFGRPESTTACECERSQSANLAQSLHLLNSKEVQAKLSDPKGRAAQFAADTRSASEKITEIYLLAMSRQPSETELKTAVDYLEKKKADPKAAYEDLLWAVINSKEFLFNH